MKKVTTLSLSPPQFITGRRTERGAKLIKKFKKNKTKTKKKKKRKKKEKGGRQSAVHEGSGSFLSFSHIQHILYTIHTHT